MPPRRPSRVKSFSQRYLSYSHEGERLRLPMLAIRLIGPTGRSVKTTALIDSGATVTFVPHDFADILDIELGEISTATGAGGSFDTNLSDVIIEILKGTKVVKVIEAEEVHIPVEEDPVPYVVLGRDTIFLSYDITFREHKELCVLRPPKRGPD